MFLPVRQENDLGEACRSCFNGVSALHSADAVTVTISNGDGELSGKNNERSDVNDLDLPDTQKCMSICADH